MLTTRMPPRQTVVASAVLVLLVATVLAIVITVVVIGLRKSEPEPGWSSDGITINTGTWTPGEPGMDAAIGGVIRIDADGCVYLGRRGVPGGADLIWPAGYTAAHGANGVVNILNPDGVVVAATGHQIRAGGGSPGRFTEFACRAHPDEGVAEIQFDLPPLSD